MLSIFGEKEQTINVPIYVIYSLIRLQNTDYFPEGNKIRNAQNVCNIFFVCVIRLLVFQLVYCTEHSMRAERERPICSSALKTAFVIDVKKRSRKKRKNVTKIKKNVCKRRIKKLTFFNPRSVILFD